MPVARAEQDLPIRKRRVSARFALLFRMAMSALIFEIIGGFSMIPVKQAYEIMINSAKELGREKILFRDALGRILAEDVVADRDLPPFDRSMRDGYACRRSDVENELEVIEIIPAGYEPQHKIEANKCAKIMTGAIVPEGADCIAMREFVEEIGGDKIRITKQDGEDYIHFRGEDIRADDVIIRSGTKILPQHIGILASVGCTKPMVSIRPRIGIIVTGNEIVEPEISPEIFQIRNSNAYQLLAQISNIGVAPKYYGIAKDDEKNLENTIRKALDENDVVIVSGGVSMGDYDFVPKIAQKIGVKKLFHKVAIKPGKPTYFGILGEKYFWGLPGNPVSTFVIAEHFVKPFIYKLMGYDYHPVELDGILGADIVREKWERDEWFPVKMMPDGTIIPLRYNNSGHIAALADADAILGIEKGVKIVKKGTTVYVRPIRS